MKKGIIKEESERSRERKGRKIWRKEFTMEKNK